MPLLIGAINTAKPLLRLKAKKMTVSRRAFGNGHSYSTQVLA